MEPVPLADQNLHEGRRSVGRVAAVTVQQRVLDAIEELSRSTFPDEACALLIGAPDGPVDELRVMENVHEPPRLRRYRMDPLAYADVDDEVEAEGRRIVGIFHSHPPAPAIPSQFDLDGALPGLWYIIHGYPDDPERTEMRAWVLAQAGDRFLEAPLIVQPEEKP